MGYYMTYMVPGRLPDTTVINQMLVIRHAFAAAGGGSPDDVAIFNANAPFGFRIVDTRFYISTGVVQLYSTASRCNSWRGQCLIRLYRSCSNWCTIKYSKDCY